MSGVGEGAGHGHARVHMWKAKVHLQKLVWSLYHLEQTQVLKLAGKCLYLVNCFTNSTFFV